ncbi:aminoglycoside phosphotransferase family protein [Paraburkholderia fungorum]|uniref:aminoglycoside phosphotransferase family protein n=1 Tax=Paraburkholderia fungorum TaxID=134537 RepID=UPI0038BB565E
MSEALATPRFELAAGTAPLGVGRTSEVFEWSPGWVVKLFRPGYPLRQIELEASLVDRVCRATYENSAFRVPSSGGIVAVAGRHGLLYRRARGQSIVSAMRQSGCGSPLARSGEQLAELHFATHRIQAGAHTRLYGLPPQHAKLRWSIEAAPDLPRRLRAAALHALAALAIRDAHDAADMCLCHGDFHPANVLVCRDGTVSLIDWMSAERGSAIGDLAKTSVLLLFGRTSEAHVISPREEAARRQVHDTYVKRYFELAGLPDGSARLARWLPLAALARLSEGIGNAERAALLPLSEQLLKEE